MDFQPKRFKKIKRIAISTSLIVSLFSVSILITGYKAFKNEYNAPKETKIEYADKHKDRIQSIEDIYKSLDKIDLKKELPFLNKSILDFFKNIKLFDSNYLKKIKTKFDEIKTKINEFPKSTLEKLSFANFKKYNSLYKQFNNFNAFSSINSLLNNLNSIRNRVLAIKDNLSKVNGDSFNLPYANKLNSILARLNSLESNFKKIDLDSISKLLSNSNIDSKKLNDSWEKIDTESISNLLTKSSKELISIEAELNGEQTKSIFDYINDFSNKLNNKLNEIHSYKEKIKDKLSTDLAKNLSPNNVKIVHDILKGKQLKSLKEKLTFNIGSHTDSIFNILASFKDIISNLLLGKLEKLFDGTNPNFSKIEKEDVHKLINNFLSTNENGKVELYRDGKWVSFSGEDQIKQEITKDISQIFKKIANKYFKGKHMRGWGAKLVLNKVFDWKDILDTDNNKDDLLYLFKNSKDTLALINLILLIFKKEIFGFEKYSQIIRTNDAKKILDKVYDLKLSNVEFSKKKLYFLTGIIKNFHEILKKSVFKYLNKEADFPTISGGWGWFKWGFQNVNKNEEGVRARWSETILDLGDFLEAITEGLTGKIAGVVNKRVNVLGEKQEQLKKSFVNINNYLILAKTLSKDVDLEKLLNDFENLPNTDKNLDIWAKNVHEGEVSKVISNFRNLFTDNQLDKEEFKSWLAELFSRKKETTGKDGEEYKPNYEEIKKDVLNILDIIDILKNDKSFIKELVSTLYKITIFDGNEERWLEFLANKLVPLLKEGLTLIKKSSNGDKLADFIYGYFIPKINFEDQKPILFKNLKPILFKNLKLILFKDDILLLNVLGDLKKHPKLVSDLYSIYSLFNKSDNDKDDENKKYADDNIKNIEEILNNVYGVLEPILKDKNKDAIIDNLFDILDDFINSGKDLNSVRDILKSDKFKNLVNSIDSLVNNKKWLKSILGLLKTFGIEVPEKYNAEFIQALFKEVKDIVNTIDETLYDDVFAILDKLTKKDIKSFKDLAPIFKDNSLLNVLNKIKEEPGLLNSIYNIYALISGNKKTYSNEQLKDIFDNVYGVLEPILKDKNKDAIIDNLFDILDDFINSGKDLNSVRDILKSDKFKNLVNSIDSLVNNKKWLKSILGLLKTFGIEVPEKYNAEFIQALFKEVKDIVNTIDETLYDDVFAILDKLTKKDIKSFKDLAPIFKDNSLLNVLNKIKEEPGLLNSIYNIYALISGNKKTYSNEQLKDIFDNVYGVLEPILKDKNKDAIIDNLFDILDGLKGEEKFNKFKGLVNNLDGLFGNKEWVKSLIDLLKVFNIKIDAKYTTEFIQKLYKKVKDIVNDKLDKTIYDDLVNILGELTKQDINNFKDLNNSIKNESFLNLLNSLKNKPGLLDDLYSIYKLFNKDAPNLEIKGIFNKIYAVVEPILKDNNKDVIIDNLLDLLDNFIQSDKKTMLDLMANSYFSKLLESLLPEKEKDYKKIVEKVEKYLGNLFKELESYKDTYELVVKNESLLVSIIKVVKAFSGKKRKEITTPESYINETKIETYLKLYYGWEGWGEKKAEQITNIDWFIKENKLEESKNKVKPEEYNYYDLIFLMTKNFLPKVVNS